MKNAIALAAVAGIATAAAAQSGSLSIVASSNTIDSTLTTSFTLSVYGDASVGTHITGAAFNMVASGGGMVTNMVADAGVATWGGLGFEDQGHTGGGNTGLVMGQIVFLPFIQPDAASALGNGPVLLGTFAVTIAADSVGVIDWSTAGGIGTFALEVIDVNSNPGGSPPGTYSPLGGAGDSAFDFGGVSVNIVPAPSAMAVLGLGGLVAGRRRR